MKGSELIVYIINNNLVDKDLTEIIRSFSTVEDVAIMFGVGRATVMVWIETEQLETVEFNNHVYIMPGSLTKFKSARNAKEVTNV